MILFINSAKFEKLTFALIDSKVKEQTFKIRHPETEKTLEYLDAFLSKNKIQLYQVKRIVVVSGAGSFTGIRVGFALAMAFSLAKDIPLFTIKEKELPKNLRQLGAMRLKRIVSEADPEYGGEPNITLK